MFTKWSVAITQIVTPERIDENGKIFDFEITEEDMKAINSNALYRRVRTESRYGEVLIL